MNDEVKRWHSSVLSQYSSDMYDKLIHEENITSEFLKKVDLENLDGEVHTHLGYFAKKNRIKYFLNIPVFKKLPIKVKELTQYHLREDVIMWVKQAAGFRVEPKHTMFFKKLIDDYMPLENTNPDMYTLCKIVAIMLQIGRGYVCISSNKGFGKSFLFIGLDMLTNKCNVCDEVRSAPMVLQQINETGNIVFDDLVGVSKEIRDTMERIDRAFGSGKDVYRNGALKSKWTKEFYNGRLQSITHLYNNINHYDFRDVEKYYFDVMFSNNEAMDDRFLKLKVDGVITTKFSRDFNIISTAKKNRQYYISFAKELAYLQEYKLSGKYVKKFSGDKSVLQLKGRKRLVYDEICWGLDQYAESQEEYDKFILLLDSAIVDYREMLMNASIISTNMGNIEEEVVE